MMYREPCEHCGKRSYCAHYPAPAHSFKARVALAATCIASGEGMDSRAFDSCFENHDGALVAVALMRQAKSDTRLLDGIKRHYSRSYAEWLADEARYSHVPDHRLEAAARQVRERANADFELQRAAWATGQTAPSQLALL